jgi:hypothetical protein
MIPTTPNTGAAKNEKYISRPTRTLKRLPQPGRSNNIIPAARTEMARKLIAALPKQYILTRSRIYRAKLVIFKDLSAIV